MTNSITITIPWPEQYNDPNARPPHWADKAKHVKAARERAWQRCVCVPGHNKQWTRARIDVQAFHKTARYKDAQNIIACLKATVDGVEDAGVIVNDAGLEWGVVDRQKDAANPRVVVTITEIAE